PQAEARHEPRRSSDTSPVDADIRPKRRAKWFSCGPLDFLDSRSIFFIATHPVWFTWQCSVVVNQFQVPGIFRPETGVSGRISSRGFSPRSNFRPALPSFISKVVSVFA